MNLEKGGRGAIERMVEAYGFKTRQALCDHLGISKSTLATRYMRDSFPAEWVIQCALETGIQLKWLATGEGNIESSPDVNTLEIPKQNLTQGELKNDGSYIFDKSFLPKNLDNPFVVADGNVEFICDKNFSDIRDGKWILSIDGEVQIRTLTRLPNARVIVEGGNRTYECALSDIKILAKIIMTCLK